MAKKKLAYMKTEKGFRVVTVYQAIKIKNRKIKNRDAEALFYDSPNVELGELVFPKRTSSNGREAHFSYYPSSTHAGIASEKSMTHIIYELAMLKVKELKLYIWGEEIRLYIKNAHPEYFVKTENNAYFIDVYLILRGTEPKSFYYKWGGKIAIEIYVTHKVSKSKAKDLELKNFQVCEVKIYDNQYIPGDLCSEKEISSYTRIVKNRLLNGKNVGKMINNVNPPKGSEWEARYLQLNQYEEEIKRMADIVGDYQKKINEQKRDIEQRTQEIGMLEEREKVVRVKIEEKKIELYNIEIKISSIERLERKNTELVEKNHDLENQVKNLNNALKEEKGKGILKRLFKR